MANRASLGDPLAARSPIAQYGTRAGIGLKSEDQPGMIGVSQLDVTPGGKMRNLLILGVLILVVAAPVRSQEYPKAEAFGGDAGPPPDPAVGKRSGFQQAATRA